MWILMLEAVAALFLLVFIVWWTMFSGRDEAARTRKQMSDTRPAPKENEPPEP